MSSMSTHDDDDYQLRNLMPKENKYERERERKRFSAINDAIIFFNIL